MVKCADGYSSEQLYLGNSLWQIVGVASPLENRLLENDSIIALDPAGNSIEIARSEFDCFVSIDINRAAFIAMPMLQPHAIHDDR